MQKRDLILLFSAIFLAAVMAFGIFLNSALPTGSWGLHFRESGAPPIAPTILRGIPAIFAT